MAEGGETDAVGCWACGAPATHQRVEGWDPRTARSNDVDVDYSYWCADHAGEGSHAPNDRERQP